MRTKSLMMVAALLLFAAGVCAQDTPKKPPAVSNNPDFPAVNEIDFGLRGTVFADGSDEARFQRYRDVRDGGTIDKLRLFKDTNEYRYTLQADHVGYRDQRFSGSYNNYGKVKASFEWNQVPLFYSSTTATLYDLSTPGVLLLPDSVQSGVQNKTLSLNQAMLGATTFDLRTRRDIANFNFLYSATPNLDWNVAVRNTQKAGEYPWGGTFGFSMSAEYPVPVDHRTTDLGTSLEYSSQRGFARIGYDGSFFHNNVPAVVWDNPLRVSDSPTAGPVQGRDALWPNTSFNTVSASGGINFARRSRVTALLSVGEMSNDNTLLPFTINSTLQSPALSRPTSDVHATVTTMNYLFTSRPIDSVWFSARFRSYDFNNKTDPFVVGDGVNYDTSIVALNKESEPFGQNRKTFDADFTYSPIPRLGFRAGYTRENVNRTYRIIEDTWEDIGRASVDLTGLPWLTVRGVYEHSKRRGSDVDTMELLSIGEQPAMRHYDIANRDSDRFSTILMVTPVSMFSVNGSVAFGKQEYPDSYFGLRNNDNHVYSIGFDFVPIDSVSFGAQYGYERYTALQASRNANPLPANTLAFLNDPTQQWNDPRRDWTDDSADRVNTVNASLDLTKVIPKTDIKIGYDYSHAQSTYTYGLAANTVLAPVVPLTPVVNELQRAIVDGKYYLTRHLAVGGVYWYDRYRVDDFALSPVASLAQPATGAASLMMLGYFYAPYTANSFMGRLTYLW